MAVTLTNARLLDLDPLRVTEGALRISGEFIEAAGSDIEPRAGDEVMDCRGAVVLPGLVNGHTHLYSALAVGMPAPPQTPKCFHEILKFVWWRLDRALDGESIEVSGTIGALDALHCGTTTLIDHHASPSHIAGSLDDLERGIDAVGLRAVLCYEATDRNGKRDGVAGVEENRRYLARCAARKDGRFAGLVGAHAAFTMSDELLAACSDLAAEFNSGVHIHVAEDPCDNRICREQFGKPLIDRLNKAGIIDPSSSIAARSILAHCTHLSEPDARRIGAVVGAVAHNPRSNMNNQVGYAPVGIMTNSAAKSGDPGPIQLGTDGIGSDMFTELRHAWFKSRDARADLSPHQIIEMMVRSARTASALLGRKLGSLAPGAAADVVITDYIPPTALTADTAAGHLIFALGAHHVRDVLVGGAWRLRRQVVQGLNESESRKHAVSVAKNLWDRMP